MSNNYSTQFVGSSNKLVEEFSGSFFTCGTLGSIDSLGGVGRVAGAKFSIQFGEVVRRLLRV